MKILIIVDKFGTAIDRLAQSVKRNLPQHQIIVFSVHPKREDFERLLEAQKLMQWADLLDIHYWKSGKVLREMFPNEFNAKKKILFHFNPYDVESEENKLYDLVVVGNKEMHNRVPYAYYIPYGIDLKFFSYNQDYTEEKAVMMSVARIEGKKGVLEVAQACKELGYVFRLVGRVSKADYMQQIRDAGGHLQFFENVTDETLRDIYKQSAILVCNSTDNFESGTLPILEAMALGVPVLTRMVGHVPELNNGGNMVINQGSPEDVESIKKHLQDMMENRQWRISLRERAWDTVKTRDERKMAIDVNKLYYKLYKGEVPFVSIIIPTKDNPESFTECLLGAIAQDHDKFEIIVADSGDTPVKAIVQKAQEQTDTPIRYIHFPHKDNYTLAEARNRGVIEADGKILVFCDDRLKMKPDAVKYFATYYRPKTWLWGTKDGAMKGFVENFSSVGREDLVTYGMFLERMQWYGGMTQSLRERFEDRLGFGFVYLQEAQAESIKRATSKSKRRDDIIDAKFLTYKMFHKI